MRLSYSIFFSFTAIILTSCVSNTPRTNINNTTASTITAPALENFCKSLKDNLTNNSHKYLNQNFDRLKFSQNVFFGINGSSKTYLAYKQGISKAIDTLPDVLAKTTNGKRWHITRFNKTVNTAKCTLRSTIEGSGVQIVEFHLHKTPTNVSIYNWHDHVKNTLASEALRSAVLDYKSFDDKINSGAINQDSKEFKEFRTLINFIQTISRNEIDSAIAQYKNLPKKYKSNPVYVQRLITQSASSPRNYRRVMDIFYKEFKNNRKYDLIFLDYFYTKKQYRKALQVITRAEKRIGKDAGLSLVKALTYSEIGNSKKFYEMCLEALNDDMSYESTYFLLFDELIRQRKHKDAVLVLDILTKVFSYSFTRDRFENDPKYAQLTKTRSFNQWIKNFN